MKTYIKYLAPLLLLILSNRVFAQAEMQGSQFIFDHTYINPAFSGIGGKVNANLHFQLNDANQGIGKSYTLSAGGNLQLDKIKSGIGVNVVKSVFGNDSYTIGYGNYVYHLPVSESTVLSSGISIGIQQFDINLSDLVTVQENDPLSGRNTYTSKFDARFGLVATINKKYYAGISFDNILAIYNNKDSYYYQVPPSFRKINMYIIGGITVDNSNDLLLQSNLLLMKTFGGLTALDLNALVTFNKGFGLGVGFRQQIEEMESVAVGKDGKTLSQSILRPMLQYTIHTAKQQQIKLGYCYSFNASRSVVTGRATHDISLVFNIP